MTSHTATSARLGSTRAQSPGRTGAWRTGTRVAGLAYLAAWIVGLSVFDSSTDVRSSGADVLRGLVAHQGAATLQFLLTEVVAGFAVAGVVLGVTRRIPRGRSRTAVVVAGLAAAGISVAQGALGIWMTATLVDRRDAVGIGQVSTALNRADGVKMLLLAAAVAALVAATSHRRLRMTVGIPRWLRRVSMLTCPALVVSGLGYLTMSDALALAAWASLPLLIVSVVGAALTIGSCEATTGRDV